MIIQWIDFFAVICSAEVDKIIGVSGKGGPRRRSEVFSDQQQSCISTLEVFCLAVHTHLRGTPLIECLWLSNGGDNATLLTSATTASRYASRELRLCLILIMIYTCYIRTPETADHEYRPYRLTHNLEHLLFPDGGNSRRSVTDWHLKWFATKRQKQLTSTL